MTTRKVVRILAGSFAFASLASGLEARPMKAVVGRPGAKIAAAA
jgi:hypothetical protein